MIEIDVLYYNRNFNMGGGYLFNRIEKYGYVVKYLNCEKGKHYEIVGDKLMVDLDKCIKDFNLKEFYTKYDIEISNYNNIKYLLCLEKYIYSWVGENLNVDFFEYQFKYISELSVSEWIIKKLVE